MLFLVVMTKADAPLSGASEEIGSSDPAKASLSNWRVNYVAKAV